MITIIVAMDENNLIGNGNALPWNLPDDLAHFKETTLNHPIIMGRKTWDSLPFRPLPKRMNIVITRGDPIDGVLCFSSIHDAIEFANSRSEEIFIIGGATIYEQTLEIADRLLISRVFGEFEGDTYFPQIDHQKWKMEADLGDRNGFRILDYRKI